MVGAILEVFFTGRAQEHILSSHIMFIYTNVIGVLLFWWKNFIKAFMCMLIIFCFRPLRRSCGQNEIFEVVPINCHIPCVHHDIFYSNTNYNWKILKLIRSRIIIEHAIISSTLSKRELRKPIFLSNSRGSILYRRAERVWFGEFLCDSEPQYVLNGLN